MMLSNRECVLWVVITVLEVIKGNPKIDDDVYHIIWFAPRASFTLCHGLKFASCLTFKLLRPQALATAE